MIKNVVFDKKFRTIKEGENIELAPNITVLTGKNNSGKTKGKANCYSEEFKKIAEQNGPEFSFNVLESLQKMDEKANTYPSMNRSINLR
jgi:predicted ATPase